LDKVMKIDCNRLFTMTYNKCNNKDATVVLYLQYEFHIPC